MGERGRYIHRDRTRLHGTLFRRVPPKTVPAIHNNPTHKSALSKCQQSCKVCPQEIHVCFTRRLFHMQNKRSFHQPHLVQDLREDTCTFHTRAIGATQTFLTTHTQRKGIKMCESSDVSCPTHLSRRSTVGPQPGRNVLAAHSQRFEKTAANSCQRRLPDTAKTRQALELHRSDLLHQPEPADASYPSYPWQIAQCGSHLPPSDPHVQVVTFPSTWSRCAVPNFLLLLTKECPQRYLM